MSDFDTSKGSCFEVSEALFGASLLSGDLLYTGFLSVVLRGEGGVLIETELDECLLSVALFGATLLSIVVTVTFLGGAEASL